MPDKTNFEVIATECKESLTPYGEVIGQKISGFLKFDDNGETPFEIDASKLDNTEWSKIDPLCQIDTNTSKAKVQRIIANDIREKLKSSPKTKEYQVDKPGLYIVEGEPVFCTAREIIRSPKGASKAINIKFTGNDVLDIDEGLEEKEAIIQMIELICLSPNPGRIILAAIIVFLLRQAYVDVGRRPWLCLYLYGETGTQKTSYSSTLSQLYHRKTGIKEPPRLNTSTAAATEILVKNRDSIVIFDDLFPADSHEITRQQEQTLIEITRYVADGTVPLRKKGVKLTDEPVECGVLFTGEYLIGGGSSAARLLPVEMVKPNVEKLRWFQNNPLVVSTFFRNFMVWALDNYSDIVKSLNNWLTNYLNTDMGVHDRLREVHYFLNSAYHFFLNYLVDKGCLTESDGAECKDDFLKLINGLVHTQNERVKPNKYDIRAEKTDYLAYIKELNNNGRISIPANIVDFNEKIHHGVIHKGRLCLRGKFLEHTFEDSPRKIATSLLSQGALYTTSKGNTYTIQICELHGKRFYAIPLECLK